MTAIRCTRPAIVILLLAACSGPAPQEPVVDDWQQAQDPSSQYLGAATCARCHAEQYHDWQGSHHDLAMQVANSDSVLGDFDQAHFDYAGIRSGFFQRDDGFHVRTDAADGQLAEFEIAYTFGVHPLQQYLVEFPDGRLQALGMAWDSRSETAGGQRWFHLYPEQQIRAGHPLHWTGHNQNWNHMCADCHSTNLDKNYDPEIDRFTTSWSEINVACEACHGPGQKHLEWALAGAPEESGPALEVVFDERRDVYWQMNLESGMAERSQPRTSQIEIDRCGQCHARGVRLTGDQLYGGSLLDTHRPALLDPADFHPDGQMLGEVFNWAPFLQSRMAEAGVTCADCHQPHSLKLRAPGNAVCAQCHLPARFDTEAHSHHSPGSTGSQCTACHMPQVTFMEIDARHDHAFRIPRPDLSISHGVPNACTDCHTEQTAEWAQAQLSDWFPAGPDRSRDFVAALADATDGAPGVRAGLRQVIENSDQPAIVRASALAALNPWLTPAQLDLPIQALNDADPLVRLAAVEALAEAPPELRHRHLGGLLDDPVLAVRIEAAAALAGPPEILLSASEQIRFQGALDEHLHSLELNADRPEARVRLGNLHARRGDLQAADHAYRQALKLDERSAEAWVNRAELQRSLGGEQQTEAMLRKGLEKLPDSADLHHALGLSLIRQRRESEALTALEQAADLTPENPHYRYVLAVALYEFGQTGRATDQLEQTLERHPHHRESLTTLAIHQARTGNIQSARLLTERLISLDPDDATTRQLHQWLQSSP